VFFKIAKVDGAQASFGRNRRILPEPTSIESESTLPLASFIVARKTCMVENRDHAGESILKRQTASCLEGSSPKSTLMWDNIGVLYDRLKVVIDEWELIRYLTPTAQSLYRV
jgi:hypothetical protein